MPHFKVDLPNDMKLLVKLTHNPCNFKIRFPGGKQVEFDFNPNATPRSTVTTTGFNEEILPPEQPGRKQRLKVSLAVGSPAITFSEAAADGSRDMEEP